MKGTITTCRNCGTEFKKHHKAHYYCDIDCRSEHQKQRTPYAIAKYRVYKRDNFRCIYCGKSSIEDSIKLNLDHIIPCGNDRHFEDLNNLVTSCFECNHSKYAFPLSKKVIDRIQKEIIKRNQKINMPMNIIIK